MGTFNFRQNKNDIYYIEDEDIKFSDISEEDEEKYIRAGDNYLVYDYDYAEELYSDIENYIHNGMSDIWSKHREFLYDNDENYVTYDEFMKFMFIETGYYEGFCIQLEDQYIDDFILQNKEVMGDIIKLYKSIGEKWPILHTGKTYGWSGCEDRPYTEAKTIYE